MNVTSSERLNYRLLGKQDAALFAQLDSDPAVMRFITGGKTNSLADIHQKALPRLMTYTDQAKGHGMWGVFMKENNEFIGWILVRPMCFFSKTPDNDNLELGWRFMRKSWGKGYATEAALQVKKALIEQGGISAVSAIAVPDNIDSVSIMKKIGLIFVKQYIHHDNQLGDIEAVHYQQLF